MKVDRLDKRTHLSQSDMLHISNDFQDIVINDYGSLIQMACIVHNGLKETMS